MRKIVIAAIAAAIAGSSVQAANVIDQSQSTLGASFVNVANYGQSFTPSTSNINFAIFDIGYHNTPTTAYVELFQGAGYGGTLLGVTAPQQLGAGLSFTQFEFYDNIALVAGATYTLRIVPTNGSYSIGGRFAFDTYTGGDLYTPSGVVSGYDLTFFEGTNDAARPVPPPAVPEPGTWGMMIIGFGATGAVLRGVRKRKAAIA